MTHPKKRSVLGCLLVFMLTVFGQFSYPGVGSAADEITVLVNGQALVFDQPPVVVGGRTMVPMAAIFTALGADVSWDAPAQMVTASRGDTTIKLIIGMQSAQVNGHETSLTPAPQIINGRTMVPLAFVAQALGADVQWDGNTRTVTIIQDGSGNNNPDISGKQVVDYFFSSLHSKHLDDALGMMDPEMLGDDDTQAMWRDTFSSFTSLTLNNIEDWNESEWTASRQIYKVELTIKQTSSASVWLDGSNTRWVYVKKINGQWKISEIASGP